VILKLLRVDPSPEMVPIRIYGVKSVKTVETITGRTHVAGMYKTEREGPVFILDISGSFDRNYGARAIAYHEFTHHLIATYTNTVYPRWYNEGLAEYLSTFRINDNGDVRIGMPSEQNARVLVSYGWMDMNILVNSVRNYPQSTGPKRQRFSQSQFYAQSWIATHYIQSHSEYAKKFKAYLTRLNQDDVPVDVFEKAFGLSPEAFGDILKRYLKQNKFNSAALTLLKHERRFKIIVKRLSKGETEFHRGEGANPQNMRAHFDYVTTYSATGDTASKQAVQSAQECANYYKSRNFVDTNMSLVSILARNNKWDFAKNLLEKSKVWSRVPQIRMTSRRMLKALSNQKTVVE